MNSGVCSPRDGSWGVAERVVITKNNDSLGQIYHYFPAWSDYEGYSVIEARRADCNFQFAYQMLLAYEIFDDEKYYKIAENILHYLYHRSGMLNRSDKEYPDAVWNWSHITWHKPLIYFDDNAWACTIQLLIARKYPALDKKFGMKDFAVRLADELLIAFNRTYGNVVPEDKNNWLDPERVWAGRLDLPHWGSLACMALANAYAESRNRKFLEAAKRYHKYLLLNKDRYNNSEKCYALIGAEWSDKYFDDKIFKELIMHFAQAVSNAIDTKIGSISAEHYESPNGKFLLDLIYTVNWALLGLQSARFFMDISSFESKYFRLLNLVVSIQDRSKEKHFRGCWRGMYDLERKEWGGGNCHEGGANSIYTGWTNIPISWVLSFELKNKSMIEY
mgnify:CR=1 FL=1